MNVRPYKIDDIELMAPLYDAFTQLNKSVSYKPDSREIFLSWLRSTYSEPNRIVFVAEEQGEVIGFAVGIIQLNKPLLMPDRIGYIGMFIVQSRYRRKGIGNSLFLKLMDWFQSNEISEIQLSTETDNTLAKKFWSSLGFTVFREERSLKI